MDVINEIIRESALGQLSKLLKGLIISIFSSIVLILIAMLVGILLNAPNIVTSYGY